MSTPELEAATPALRELHARLVSLGFTEQGVRARLSVPEPFVLALSATPWYLTRRLHQGEPLDRAISLFLLQQPAELDEAVRLLGEVALHTLDDLGLLMVDRERAQCWSAFSLFPIGEQLFFSDHRFAQLPGWRRPPEQPVMAPGIDTHLLARGLWPGRVSTALDLCTGCGAIGLLAARRGARVTAVDLSERAVRVARLNAAMQGLDAEILQGDLFAPIKDARYDLIVANPPFVPSPEQTVLYRDGGPSGAEVLTRILANLSAHLTEGGVAQIVTQVAERAAGEHLALLRGWLGDAALDLHCLQIRADSAEELAIANASGGDFSEWSYSVKRWAQNLADQGITRAVTLLVTLTPASGVPSSSEDQAALPTAPFGKELSHLIAARGATHLPPLLRSRYRPSPGMELIDRRPLDGGPLSTTLTFPPPLAREVTLDQAERAQLLGEIEATNDSLKSLVAKGVLIPT